MDNDKYLFKLQEEYSRKSKVYLDSISQGKRLIELKELAQELRSLLVEIKAVKQEIKRGR